MAVAQAEASAPLTAAKRARRHDGADAKAEVKVVAVEDATDEEMSVDSQGGPAAGASLKQLIAGIDPALRAAVRKAEGVMACKCVCRLRDAIQIPLLQLAWLSGAFRDRTTDAFDTVFFSLRPALRRVSIGLIDSISFPTLNLFPRRISCETSLRPDLIFRFWPMQQQKPRGSGLSHSAVLSLPAA